MKRITKMAAGLLMGMATVAITAPAFADVVCNSDGECWHVHRHYEYKPEFGVTVHPDTWQWGQDDHYRWREHSGRGYWRSGVWIAF